MVFEVLCIFQDLSSDCCSFNWLPCAQAAAEGRNGTSESAVGCWQRVSADRPAPISVRIHCLDILLVSASRRPSGKASMRKHDMLVRQFPSLVFNVQG